ncbi:hypothetical protein ACFYU9_22210 [Streptomyces sp. NPDC004327]|uniref:hypothetical protein n=1 Tax=Streptomyces sp. NPDC004327 TaxID=3364699 RepID=UPI0036A92BC7
MSGADPDLEAGDGALRRIAEGIDKAHQELKDLSVGQQAVSGRGFSKLSLTGVQLGHQGLAEEFGTFCDRWGWGVRDLMQKAGVFTTALGLTAGAIGEQEEYVKGTFKIVTNGVNGNPHLSEDEVGQKSWAEIRDQSPYDGADWSEGSFRDAQSRVEQAWRDTTYDVGDGVFDTVRNAGLLDPAAREAIDARMREQLEPTEETVRRAQEPNWGDR